MSELRKYIFWHATTYHAGLGTLSIRPAISTCRQVNQKTMIILSHGTFKMTQRDSVQCLSVMFWRWTLMWGSLSGRHGWTVPEFARKFIVPWTFAGALADLYKRPEVKRIKSMKEILDHENVTMYLASDATENNQDIEELNESVALMCHRRGIVHQHVCAQSFHSTHKRRKCRLVVDNEPLSMRERRFFMQVAASTKADALQSQ